MQTNYLILNAFFLLGLFVIDWKVLGSKAVFQPKTWFAVGIVVLLTLIFDNMIVGFGIVTYDTSKISGIRLGYAPIEDFCYAIAAPILMHSLLIFYGKSKKNS